MNLIGKILLVLIAIMSIVFMGLAVTVYSSHRNWYAQAQTLEDNVAELRTQLRQAGEQTNRLESKLTGELEAAQQQIRKLQGERETLESRNQGLQAELDQLRQESRDQIAAVSATQQNNDRLVKEVQEQRQAVRENQQARDLSFGVMLEATEQRDQTLGELQILQNQNRQLAESVARMTKLLRSEGVDPGIDPDFVMEPTDGIVSAIRRRGSTQLIEVTLGSDDGLQAGHTVEVFRGDKYLGRAEIISTAPDKAIGRLDRRFLQGQIQEGDRVATRLKLS